jgi:hypothetical protein
MRRVSGESVGVGAQLVLEERADVVGVRRELCPHEIGVDECLLLGSGLVLVEQVAASESVGHTDQHDAGEQRDEREEERDPRAKTKSPTSSHEDRVLQVATVACVRAVRPGPGIRAGSPAAGETPGGGWHLTGAA